ncbi:MAG: tRNA (adenosine(37)-N6)-threonylcarbamoyltransferase complex dimerization subunit type 1 TsaB [Candidatus Edwardsbacteria bacterium]
MKILAVDTSTDILGLAIIEAETSLSKKVLGQLSLFTSPPKHAERLLSAIEEMFLMLEIEREEIDAFAISLGPGSFTGLRIGLATLKGICLSFGKPLIGVPTLDALALSARFCPFAVYPMLDAKRQEIYTAKYSLSQGTLERFSECETVSPEKLIRKLKETPEEVLFLGAGSEVYRGFFQQELKEKLHFLSPNILAPNAAHIAWLGWERLQKKEFSVQQHIPTSRDSSGDDLDTLEPIYLRPSSARLPTSLIELSPFAMNNCLSTIIRDEPKITILPMTELDLDEILKIEQASFPDPWKREMFLHDIQETKQAFSIVAKQREPKSRYQSGGEVVGYAVVWFVIDEMHLGNIAVAHSRRKKGIGRKLLAYLLDEAKKRNCQLATLEVRVSNEAAISLYRNFGFKEVAIRKKYYRDEDGLVMIKELEK